MIHRHLLRAMTAALFSLLLGATAQAQPFRTYLSFGGNDANPCSIAAPCRLLPAAISAVAAGGEVWMLDSANYNTAQVNIAKSVTVLAVPGALGSLTSSGGGSQSAVNIATAGVRVVLRNIVIVPLLGNTGNGGVSISAGDSVTLEGCEISGLGNGILGTGSVKLLITDTTVRDGGHGLELRSGARATVARSVFSASTGSASNGYANVFVQSGSSADIADSTLDGNGYGVYVTSSGTSASKVSLQNSQVVSAAGTAVFASASGSATATLVSMNSKFMNNSQGLINAGGKMLLTGNTISDNGSGINNTGGLVESAGDNTVRNNGTNTSGTITAVSKL